MSNAKECPSQQPGECATGARPNCEGAQRPGGAEAEATNVSQSESDEMVEAQRAMSEGVGSLESQLARVKVTHATRISDLNSSHFQNDMSAAAETQRTLVEAAATAAERLLAGSVDAADVGAVVDEALVALMNDLMMSEASEGFFGVSVPISDTVDLAEGIPDDMLGLLSYRVWQLLTRTKTGRRTLLACGEQDPELLDSYAAVHGVLVDAILRGEQIDFFLSCIGEMQVGNGRNTGHSAPVLSRYEKRHIEAAVRDGALDWKLVKRN